MEFLRYWEFYLGLSSSTVPNRAINEIHAVKSPTVSYLPIEE